MAQTRERFLFKRNQCGRYDFHAVGGAQDPSRLLLSHPFDVGPKFTVQEGS